MKRPPILIFAAAVLLAVPANGRQVSGVEMPEAIEISGASLLLNGAGVRTRFFVQFYVGGLPIRDKIDALIAVYDKGVAADDVFDIVYLPDTGVEVYRNGVHTETIRGGLAFKRALFGIWISDRPVQESLKRGMLGR